MLPDLGSNASDGRRSSLELGKPIHVSPDDLTKDCEQTQLGPLTLGALKGRASSRQDLCR